MALTTGHAVAASAVREETAKKPPPAPGAELVIVSRM
jgi:hypothetical protein